MRLDYLSYMHAYIHKYINITSIYMQGTELTVGPNFLTP
jgi:hypothetical protein